MEAIRNAFRNGPLKFVGYILLALVVLSLLGAGSTLSVLLAAVDPPVLPKPNMTAVAEWDSGQNWSAEMSAEFHHKSQGSRTLNIPTTWFMALEQPSSNIFSFLLRDGGKFSAPSYLSRFGFIPQQPSADNTLGLPVGFAVTPYQTIVGIKGGQSAIGFTCAACHTGQLIFENRRYLIEGGPAMVDLGQLTFAIEAALGQTVLASDLPVLNGRFERFAHQVLGHDYTQQAVAQLKADLISIVNRLKTEPNGIDVVEGFSRLDALNRIGNQVFAIDTGRYENYVNINSPVNFPHIWTSSWFNWVQYDGSIMQPLIRNVGEAMGTAALTNYTAAIDQGRFSTAVPLDNLRWIESALAGSTPPLEAKAFTGLRSPAWPEAFGPIDMALAARGADLYAEHCAACHRPALTKSVEQGQSPSDEFWNHFSPIEWQDQGVVYKTRESVLDVQIVGQDYLGTDPGQGNVLALRTIDTAADSRTGAGNIGINIDVCVRQASIAKPGDWSLEVSRIDDNPLLPYPYALGAVVQQGINQWFRANRATSQDKQAMEGDRPNCLQAGQGYKARPLNGVWATAPFLHNGAVPSLRHLLGNPADRPEMFVLGDPTFDPVNVGIAVRPVPNTDANYTADGYFILRTSVPGNSNAGHEFREERGQGRIGPALAPEAIDALVEFLKSM